MNAVNITIDLASKIIAEQFSQSLSFPRMRESTGPTFYGDEMIDERLKRATFPLLIHSNVFRKSMSVHSRGFEKLQLLSPLQPLYYRITFS